MIPTSTPQRYGCGDMASASAPTGVHLFDQYVYRLRTTGFTKALQNSHIP
ncbi:hypothetical protein [Pseudomonas haemolytica]|nr:hypothetical protein [Pseudomonas haemolytica]